MSAPDIWSLDVLRPDGTPALLVDHQRALVDGSGLCLDVIRERGYCSAMSRADLRGLGFSTTQQRLTPALVLPVHPPDDSGSLVTIRPDHPRADSEGRPRKYELPAGSSVRLDVPPRCRSAATSDPTVLLWLTEGQKKADALASRGLCAAALLGVWQFLGKDKTGSVKLSADLDLLALKGRTVNVVFDSDVMVKPEVRKALDRLTEHLQRKGATVNAVYLPNLPNGSKCGVDDFLLTHDVDELAAQVSAPRRAATAATPLVELLDEPPPALTRLLQDVDGHGYAVTWLPVRRTTSEIVVKGEVVRLPSPQVTTGRELYVVRDDGTVFGEGGDKPVAELGFEVNLTDVARGLRLWRTPAVKRYRASNRPDPRDVFARMVEAIDRFMVFDRSLAGQREMCQLIACYALATWFLDAFPVFGYLWPNGDRGAGKTKLGRVTCELSYLGQVLLSGSTLATLRDLADLGATLLFDDVEAAFDPRKADPDKRALLLAGNRKGAQMTVKEPGPDGTWRIRSVNVYCPRMFTAIRLPDPVLASRSIVIPVVRSADVKKVNADPDEPRCWPVDHGALVDDLWAVALANLSAMPAHVAAVDSDAPIEGRALEPWRPILSVAHWLDELGETGLYDAMRRLSVSYQTERVDLETTDLTRLVVRALCELVAQLAVTGSADPNAPLGPLAPLAPLMGRPPLSAPLCVSVSDVTIRVNAIARDEGIWEDEDAGAADAPADPADAAMQSTGPKRKRTEYASNKRVGRVLAQLRLREVTRKGSGGKRQREVSVLEADSLARSYGLATLVAAVDLPPGPNGANGATGANGADDAHPDASERSADSPAGRPGICATPGCGSAVFRDGLCYHCLAGEPVEVRA